MGRATVFTANDDLSRNALLDERLGFAEELSGKHNDTGRAVAHLNKGKTETRSERASEEEREQRGKRKGCTWYKSTRRVSERLGLQDKGARSAYFGVLGTRNVHERLCGRVNNVQELENGCSVVGDGHRAYGMNHAHARTCPA